MATFALNTKPSSLSNGIIKDGKDNSFLYRKTMTKKHTRDKQIGI